MQALQRLVTACQAAIIILLAVRPAIAEHVALSPYISTFAASALGGIRTVLRYETPHPNQTEIDTLLLASPSDKPDGTPIGDEPSGSPFAIQVQGLHGDDVKLVDNYGADCTLAKIGIYRQASEVIVIKAWRSDDVPHVMGGSLAQPGPMNVQIFRRHDGGEAGESSPLFKAADPPSQSKPICSDTEVQKTLDNAAATAFKSVPR